MAGMTNFFEKLEHHTRAEKALIKAKAIEAKKLARGDRYIQMDDRTWKLGKGET